MRNTIDFYFIADHLNELEVVDLAGVTILACNSAEAIYCLREFNADELPVGAFGGMALSCAKLPVITQGDREGCICRLAEPRDGGIAVKSTVHR